MELVADIFWNVTGKYIVEDSSIDDALIGGNASEEAAAEGDDGDSNKVLIPDIVAASKLQECVAISTKKRFQGILREVCEKADHESSRERCRSSYLPQGKHTREVLQAVVGGLQEAEIVRSRWR